MIRRLSQALEAVTALSISASLFGGLLLLAGLHNLEISEPTIALTRDAPVARFVPLVPEGRPDGAKGAETESEEPGEPQPAHPAASQADDSEAAIAATTPHTRRDRSPGQAAMTPTRRSRTGDGEASDRSRSGAGGSEGSRKGRQCEADDPRVDQLDAYEYAVDTALFDYYTTHLVEADELAFTSWHTDDRGQVDGFRVRGMGCGNLLRQGGLKNGDVVHRVNDQDVRTLRDALRAYKRLRDERVLRLTVTRRNGSRVKLKYKLR